MNSIKTEKITLEEILQESLRVNIDEGVRYINNDPKRFHEAYVKMFSENRKMSPRIARVVYYASELWPWLAMEYHEELIHKLPEIKNTSVRSSVLRLLLLLDLPEDEELLGHLADHCFTLFEQKSRMMSQKIFSLEILAKIAEKEVELKPELAIIIQTHLPYEKPSFQVRGRRILKSFGYDPNETLEIE